MPPTKFVFRVEYQSLDAMELAVFRLAVTLQAGEDALVHKLGFSKSQGLGSCRVRIGKGDEIADAVRREALERETRRYANMNGFRELVRWRTEKR